MNSATPAARRGRTANANFGTKPVFTAAQIMVLTSRGGIVDMVLRGAGFRAVVGVKSVEILCRGSLCSALNVT